MLGFSLGAPTVALLSGPPGGRWGGGARGSVLEQALLQIKDGSRLLQSFRVDARDHPPAIWKQRLGPLQAQLLWKRHDGSIWWKSWPAEGQTVLALPEQWTTEAPSQKEPASKSDVVHQLSGITLFFADALNRQTFAQNIASAEIAPPPLERHCVAQLSETTAVAWTPQALATIAGPIQPLLQTGAYGCLALKLQDDSLHWRGVVASRPLRGATQRLSPPRQATVITGEANDPPSGSSAEIVLLQLNSRRADTVFGELLNRPLIRNGLDSDYGLSPSLLADILDAPISLQVKGRRDGPFQASLQLDLQIPDAKKKATESALGRISARLENNGLTSSNGTETQGQSEPHSSTHARQWFRVIDGQPQLIGGWTWIPAEQDHKGHAVLRLTLAEASNPRPPSGMSLKHSPPVLRLTMQPSALESLGLMNNQWPTLIRRAGQLDLEIHPLRDADAGRDDWQWMRGQLALPETDSN